MGTDLGRSLWLKASTLGIVTLKSSGSHHMDQLYSSCSKAVDGARRPEEVERLEATTRSVDMKNKEKVLEPPF